MCLEGQNFLFSLPRNEFQWATAFGSTLVLSAGHEVCLHQHDRVESRLSSSVPPETSRSEVGCATQLKAAAVSPDRIWEFKS